MGFEIKTWVLPSENLDSWRKPKEDWITLNIDGASKGNSELTWVGILIGDVAG